AAVPGRELMRRRAIERVLHAVNIHAAGTKACGGPGSHRGRMASHDDVGTIEHPRFHHHRFAFGRHHLLAGTAENGDSARRDRAGEKLETGHGRSKSYRPLTT